jgi:hypothetical protein
VNPWLCVLRALPVTFVVYLIGAAFSAPLALPLGAELEHTLSLPFAPEWARVSAIEGLAALAPALRVQGLTLALSLALFVLLSPLLQMAWLKALSSAVGPVEALREGVRLYGRACAVSLVIVVTAVIALVPWAMLSYGLHGFLLPRTNIRVHDLAVILALAPALPTVVLCALWHDLARARCLHTGSIRASLAALRDVTSSSLILRFVIFGLISVALSLGLSLALPHLKPWQALSGIGVAALVQGVALLRAVVRSRWLTDALAQIDEPLERSSKRPQRAEKEWA